MMKAPFKAFAAATILLTASQLAAHAEDAPAAAAAPAAPAAIQAAPVQSAPAQTPDEKPTYAARPAAVNQNNAATPDATTEPPRHHRHYARRHYYWRHYAYWEPFPIFFPHLYHNRIVWNRVRWF